MTADITTDLVKENPYRYSGYYFDRKTQFYYLQARYYDPRIGRFISMDPLRGDMTNPLSLNRYVYGLNNPINYIDPTGHMAIRQIDNFFKGFVSGVGNGLKIGVTDLWDAVQSGIETGKLIASGSVTGKDLVVSFGQSIVAPFTNLYNKFNIVLRDKPRQPTDNEVYKYGESSGEVISILYSMFTGSGFKTLFKKLDNTIKLVHNNKKIKSGNSNTNTNSNQKYNKDADGDKSKLKEVDQLVKNYKLSDERYNKHILDLHGPNSTAKNKSKFKSTFDIKRGINDTLKDPDSLIKPNSYNREGYIFEKKYDKPIGTNKHGNPINTLKVVLDENGNVITAYPK